MLHQNVLLSSRISELEEQLEIITKRKSRKRKRIQYGGTMEYSTAAAQVAAEASTAVHKPKKARRRDNNGSSQLTLRRCRNCGETGHNARTCKIDIERSSESGTSTQYIGSLFGSDENDDI